MHKPVLLKDIMVTVLGTTAGELGSPAAGWVSSPCVC